MNVEPPASAGELMEMMGYGGFEPPHAPGAQGAEGADAMQGEGADGEEEEEDGDGSSSDLSGESSDGMGGSDEELPSDLVMSDESEEDEMDFDEDEMAEMVDEMGQIAADFPDMVDVSGGSSDTCMFLYYMQPYVFFPFLWLGSGGGCALWLFAVLRWHVLHLCECENGTAACMSWRLQGQVLLGQQVIRARTASETRYVFSSSPYVGPASLATLTMLTHMFYSWHCRRGHLSRRRYSWCTSWSAAWGCRRSHSHTSSWRTVRGLAF